MVGLPKQTDWRDMVRTFKALGWTGPTYGGPHPVMHKGTIRQPITNPGKPVHVSKLKDILRKAGITDEEWNAART